MDWIQILVNLVAAGAGAAIAGFLGVRFALSRAREERAFERRLEWYEKTLAAGLQLRLAIKDALKLGTRESWKKVAELHPELWAAVGQARLYGLQEDAEEVERLLFSYALEGEWAEKADILGELQGAIAAAGRRHFGFPPLDSDALNRASRAIEAKASEE